MTSETITALAAASVIVGPVVVNVIVAVRTRRDVVEVKQLVNGHSTRVDAHVKLLEQQLLTEKEKRR